MGKIVISTNVSLDGVVQDPTARRASAHGGWFGQFGGTDLEAWAEVVLEEARAPRRCCWVAAATSGSPSAGHARAASGRTG